MIRATCARFAGLPLRAPSRSTTCSARAPSSTHRRAASSGSASYSVLAVEVALAQAHRLAAQDVDRRQQDHARSRLPPALGAPLGPRTEPRSWRASAGRAPRTSRGGTGRRTRSRARRSSQTARRTRSCRRCRLGPADEPRANARGRRGSLRQAVRRSARIGARSGPRSSRCAEAAGRASASGVTSPRNQPEPLGLLELLGAVEQQLHPEADAEQRRAGERAFSDQLVEPELAQVCASPAGTRRRRERRARPRSAAPRDRG